MAVGFIPSREAVESLLKFDTPESIEYMIKNLEDCFQKQGVAKQYESIILSLKEYHDNIMPIDQSDIFRGDLPLKKNQSFMGRVDIPDPIPTGAEDVVLQIKINDNQSMDRYYLFPEELPQHRIAEVYAFLDEKFQLWMMENNIVRKDHVMHLEEDGVLRALSPQELEQQLKASKTGLLAYMNRECRGKFQFIKLDFQRPTPSPESSATANG